MKTYAEYKQEYDAEYHAAKELLTEYFWLKQNGNEQLVAALRNYRAKHNCSLREAMLGLIAEL
jgi:hypothetical protein